MTTLEALARSVADLERRLARVERGDSAERVPSASGGTWWLLDELATRRGAAFERDGAAGSVAFGGRTITPGAGDISWQIERPVPDLLEQDWEPAVAVLAALAHPVRLAVVRCLLGGARTLADLQQIPGLGTTGQLQHHLRELRGAGVVVAPRRNDYAVTPSMVVPCLVLVAAASGTGERGAQEPSTPAR